MSNQSSFSTTTIALIIVSLVMGAGGGYFLSISSFQEKISDLDNQVSTLNSEIASLNTEINSLQDTNLNLETHFIELNTQISELISQKSSLETQLENAQNMINDTARARIDELQSKIGSFHFPRTYINTPGYDRYSTFGITFEYPKGYRTSLSDQYSRITEKEGSVSVESNDGTEVYNVTWYYNSTELYPLKDLEEENPAYEVRARESLYEVLVDSFSEFPQQGLELGPVDIWGAFQGYHIYLLGHQDFPMVYQYYTISNQGVSVYGVFALTYIHKNNLYLTFHYMRDENPEVFDNFLHFLNSFDCVY